MVSKPCPLCFQCSSTPPCRSSGKNHLGAAPQERIEERTGHANGYKDNTRLGQITVAVSQGREVNGQGGGIYPQSLERGTRSERALKLALAEMYVQGVSTRRVTAITHNLNHRCCARLSEPTPQQVATLPKREGGLEVDNVSSRPNLEPILRRQYSTNLFPLALPYREGRNLLRGGFKKPCVTAVNHRAALRLFCQRYSGQPSRPAA